MSKYFSMFSGIGGFEIGIQRAYSNQQVAEVEQNGQGWDRDAHETRYNVRSRSHTPLCIGYSEIDKYAIKVYERHFEHENYGDATTIDERKLPDFDLLVGGFPCQAFSIAGKRRGFDETRGTLFFDIARILKHKRPRHLVLENVKGLLSHDSGKTFQTILGVLSDLGYRVEWQVLNAKDFGVPQNRERIFIIGHLRGECGRQVLSITGTNQQDIINPLKGKTPYGWHFEQNIYDPNGLSRSLKSSEGSGNKPKIIHNIYGGFKETKPRVFDNISPTIRTPKGGGHLPMLKKGVRIRRLTPLECERLMGYPDDWTAGESDTQRYKMCGNGIVSNVVQSVIQAMELCLTNPNLIERNGDEDN